MSPRKKSPAVTIGNDAPMAPTRFSSRIRALSAKAMEVANPPANDLNGTIGLVAARKTLGKCAQEEIDTEAEGGGHGNSGRVGGSDVGNQATKNTRASRGYAKMGKEKKEELDATEEEVKEEGEGKPVAMKSCAANAKTALKIEGARKTDPAVKGKAKNANDTDGNVDTDDVEDDVAVDKDENNLTTKKPALKKPFNEGSASKRPMSEKLESSIMEKPETKESPRKMVGVKHSKTPPVDSRSGLDRSYEVLVTADGVWDATLNQTNVGNNANKFYVLQLLHPVGNSSQVTLFTCWGRVGENGQNQKKGPWPPSIAVQEFKKQFKAKAAVDWEKRVGMVQKKGKYQWIEKSYGNDEGANMTGSSKKQEEDEKIPDSTLGPELQQLVKLIFNQSVFAATLSSLNYDSSKLPLGKLSRSTILNGFSALKALSEVVSQSGSDISNQNSGFRQAVEHLTNHYYSIIPHVFGRHRPTIIDTLERLKRELELVNTLGDMEIATQLLSSAIPKDVEGNPMNPLDANFRLLGLSSMAPVAGESKEFDALEAYTRDTHGATHHHYGVQVLNAFRVEREGETRAWEVAGFGGLKDGERLLLWHGSRTTNFAGILKQGLRIAPHEAPVTGYMFGKGVYFADMMSKSANYCHADLSDNTGILLLCEVVAKPFLELYNGNHHADEECRKAGVRATKGLGRTQPAEWQDAGDMLDRPELRGCLMPKGPGKDVSDPNVDLQYNEYIVYDSSQVRLRYLLMVNIEQLHAIRDRESDM